MNDYRDAREQLESVTVSHDSQFDFFCVGEVRAMLAEVDHLRAAVERVEKLLAQGERLADVTFMGSPFPPAVTLADLRAALALKEDE